MKLLSSQKSQILKELIKSGFKANDFEIKDPDPNSSYLIETTKIIFKKNPEYYLSFSTVFLQGKLQVTCLPGLNTASKTYEITTFSQSITYVTNWGVWLKREVEAGDFLLKMMEDISSEEFKFSDTKDEFFSDGEKQQIKTKINELKLNIKVSIKELNPYQIKFIERKLDTLEDKMDVLDKSSWRIFYFGLFIEIMMYLNPSHETAKSLWHLFQQFITIQFLIK